MNQKGVMRMQGHQKSETLPEILDRLKSMQREEILNSLDFEIHCESDQCAITHNRPPHRADWLIRKACHHLSYWCNLRFMEYGQDSRSGKRLGRHVICKDCKGTVEVTWWKPIRLGV